MRFAVLIFSLAPAVFGQVEYLSDTAPHTLDSASPQASARFLKSPSGVLDGNRVIYACSGTSAQADGDHIMRSEATGTPQLSGSKMNAPVVAMGPQRWAAIYGENWATHRTFDQGGVCDPEPIRIGSDWFMFYSGLNPAANSTSSIGLARSADGKKWDVWHPAGWRNEEKKQGGGEAILKSAPPAAGEKRHGTAHPSVVWLKPYVYLFYQDSEARYYGPSHQDRHPEGAGVFVLRSTDITFQSNVEALTAEGFTRLTGDINSTENGNYKARTSYPLQYVYPEGPRELGISEAAVQYSDMLNGFVVAGSGAWSDRGYIQLNFYPDLTKAANSSFQRVLPVDSFWASGLGLIRRPDGHSIASTSCGQVPLEVLGNWTSNARSGPLGGSAALPENRSAYADRLVGVATGIQSDTSCPSSIWPGVFEGYRLEKAGYPSAVALDGVRVELQRSVASHLSRNVIRDFTDEQFFSFRQSVSLQPAASTVQPPGAPAGLMLLDNQVWVTNCSSLIRANGSQWPPTPVALYGASIGGSLFCLF